MSLEKEHTKGCGTHYRSRESCPMQRQFRYKDTVISQPHAKTVSLQRHCHLSAACKNSFVTKTLVSQSHAKTVSLQRHCHLSAPCKDTLISQPHAKTVSLQRHSHLSAPFKDSFVTRTLISQPHAKTVSLKRHPRPPIGLLAGLYGLQCKTLRVRMRTFCLAFSRKLHFFHTSRGDNVH